MPTDPHPPPQPRSSSGNPVRAAAFVIYGTLGLLLLTMPASVVSWLQDRDSSVVQFTALRAAQAVQWVSDTTGLSAPYDRVRRFFLERIRGECAQVVRACKPLMLL
jgi:hypothetical protein